MLFVLLFGYLITNSVLVASVCRLFSVLGYLAQYYLFITPRLILSETIQTLARILIFGLLAFLPLAETFVITLGSPILTLQCYEFVCLLVSLTQMIVITEASIKVKALVLGGVTFSYAAILINRLPSVLVFYLFAAAILMLFNLPDTVDSRAKLSNYINTQVAAQYSDLNTLHDRVSPKVIESLGAHPRIDVLVNATVLLIEVDQDFAKLVEEFNLFCKAVGVSKVAVVAN